MSWDIRSIEGMERTCHTEADCNCNKMVKGKWLEVVYHSSFGSHADYYTYTYGEMQISRERAQAIIQESQNND